MSGAVSIVECVHRRIGRGDRCGAGVELEKFRDEEGRLPCVSINRITGAIPCDDVSMPTADGKANLGRAMRSLELLEEGRCPTCGEKVTKQETTAELVIAKPCGHRLKSTPAPRPVRPRAAPRSAAGAQDRWERDHDDDDRGKR